MPYMSRLCLNRKSKRAWSTCLLLLCLLVFHMGCKESVEQSDSVRPVNKYFQPDYGLVQLVSTADTLHFLLDDSTFNSIKSFSLLTKGGNELISFYDERTVSLNVYDLRSHRKVSRLSIKDALKGHSPYKTSAYMLGPDNIFVNNNKTFYQLDGAGNIKTQIRFVSDPPLAWATFKSNIPAVFKDGCLYASVRPYMNDKSVKALKEWKVLYEFNLKERKASLKYHLPEFLQKNLYGNHLLDHSYCINDRGYFVFSFPADSAIYETNLKDYHVAYSGKSIVQQAVIQPMAKNELDEDGNKKYAIRHSYGSIYYDPVKRRYLRVAKKGMSELDYKNKKEKEQRVVIFDENLKIVGESVIDDSINLKSLFITREGAIYARIMPKDEYSLHFVRLVYNEKSNEPVQIAKK
jgi:hypothetical protein